MRKLVFSINITLDGYIDHTAVIADDELHERAAELLLGADVVLYGRVAYTLMAEAWPAAASDETLSPSVRTFADVINKIDKIVYSKTMATASWNTRIVREVNPTEIRAMKHSPGKNILLGPGAGIARVFMDLDLIDEYRFLIQPILLGKGLRLFADNEKRKDLRLIGQNTLRSGVKELVYAPIADSGK